MMTMLFLTPLFYYTPIVVLSSIIVAAMLGLIDYEAAIHLWQVDKFDFLVCMSAYIGVVFASIEVGLVLAVSESHYTNHVWRIWFLYRIFVLSRLGCLLWECCCSLQDQERWFLVIFRIRWFIEAWISMRMLAMLMGFWFLRLILQSTLLIQTTWEKGDTNWEFF